MLCARARPLFPLTFSASKRSPRLKLSYSFKSSLSSRNITMSSTTQIIEHVVLFKVKEDTDPGKVSSMVNGLNSLVSLDPVVHLSAGPVHCPRSNAASGFTHMLHSRYKSKDDLGAYSAHPDHMRVVKGSVLPICDDIMAVDWIADHVPETLAPPPGSAARVTFLKLKENVPDEAKSEILGAAKGILGSVKGIDQITCGENFSPVRARGFSIASVAVFKDLSDLEAVDSQQELMNLQKERVGDYLDSVIVVDYVLPSSSQSSSL